MTYKTLYTTRRNRILLGDGIVLLTCVIVGILLIVGYL